ncbi:MAG: SpoIIIAH-like family protein [Gemmiger sp.]|nr:SpoIIIAH-like family protein [Gemmiger sp.]
MKKKTGSRGITLLALTAALGAAVYLNWSFAQNAPEAVTTGAQDGVEVALDGTQQASAPVEGEGDTITVFDPLHETAAVEATGANANAAGEASSEAANKNYGEAQLVSVNQDAGSEFFEAARLSRAKTRDEALDTIKKTLKNTALTADEKSKLTAELNAKVSSITVESDLETLIKAKGFADCVVMLDGDIASVTVMTENDALTAAEVTKIRDIILGKCRGMTAQNITVVEVK